MLTVDLQLCLNIFSEGRTISQPRLSAHGGLQRRVGMMERVSTC